MKSIRLYYAYCLAFPAIFLVACSGLQAQQVIRAEYYVDADPGFGNGIPVPVAPGTDVTASFQINLGSVPAGFHKVFFRAYVAPYQVVENEKNETKGGWSLTSSRVFYKENFATSQAAPADIVRGEYFLDADPGVGRGSNIPVTVGKDLTNVSLAVDISAVGAGFHRLYVRFQDVNNNWSLTAGRIFYKETLDVKGNATVNIVKGEYYIDADPGFGNGQNIALTPGTDLTNVVFATNLSGVDRGFHKLYTRFKDANGAWSHTAGRPFFKEAFSPADSLPKIIKLEYFVDTDPGFGRGKNVPIMAKRDVNDLIFPIDISDVAVGNHKIYVRAQDSTGSWSLTGTGSFKVEPSSALIITVGSIQQNLCAGQPVSVPYSVSALFGADNTFTAQLSNSNGSFVSPVNIGTLATNKADTIKATIPSNTPAGNGYRIRITANSPQDTSAANTQDLTINQIPVQNFTITGKSATCTGSQTYSASVAQPGNARYFWELSGGGTLDTSGANATVTWNTAGTYILKLTVSNSCGTGLQRTLDVAVYNEAPTQTPVISRNDRWLYASSVPAGISAYQWYLNAVAIPGATAASYYASENGSYTVRYTNPCSAGPESQPVVVAGTVNPPVNDIGVSALIVPRPGCGLTSNETVTVRITNYGNTSLTGFTIGYRINNQAVVSEQAGTVSLIPGASVQYSFATKADLSALGTYTVRAFSMLATDSIHTNDTLVALVQHLQGLNAPGNLLPANGASNVSQPVNLSWSAVTNATGYNLYIWKSSDTMPALPQLAGLSQINFSYYRDASAYGTEFKWKVEAMNNDCRSSSEIKTFTFRYLPDVTVSQITAPSTGISESDINVSWKVTNQGQGSTEAGKWTDYVYLSESLADPLNGYLLGSYENFSALNAGQSYVHPAATFKIPQGYQGRYYIVIKTNVSKSLLETTDTNNLHTASIDISLAPPPDLQVTGVVVSPTTVFSEDTLTVSWTVKNAGTGPTTASLWTDAVYLGKAPVYNANEAIFLGNFVRREALSSDGSYTQTRRYKVPAKLEGAYYIHVLTDLNNQVYEYVKENNNTGTGNLQIILRPAPNLTVSSLTIPYDTVSSNQNIIIQYVVNNEGAAAANPPWQDNISLTGDTSYSSPVNYNLGNYVHNDTLPSLSSTGAQMSVRLPARLSEGKYYFFVKTDLYDQIFEAIHENDNLSKWAGPVYVVNPDLKPLSVQAPAAAVSERNIAVSWTVGNIGKGILTNTGWADHIYLSADTVLDPVTDTRLASVSNNVLLNAGSQYARQQTVSLPKGIEGTWYVFVLTDGINNIYEKDENNNRMRVPINITIAPWPDLQVTSVLVPSSDTAGTNINISYTVKNTGKAAIENISWVDGLYLSATNTINDPNKILLSETNNLRSLDTGQSYTVSMSVKLPATISGQYYLLVQADKNNDLFEYTGETNNSRLSSAISISTLPVVDLAVVSGKINANTLTAGQSVTVEWTAKNTASIATITDTWKDAVYLSNNPVLDANDRLVGSWTIRTTVAPGGMYAQTQSITIPNDLDGILYLLINVDAGNQHNDNNRTNNTLVLRTAADETVGIPVTLPPPSDLLPLTFQSPAEGIANQPLTVSYAVKNNGIGNTNKDNWTDRVYLSTDLTLDPYDTPIGTFNHSTILEPGSSYSETRQVFIPMGLSGNYVLILKTDAADNVYEHNGENNNLAFGTIVIKPQEPCDLVITQIAVPAGKMIAGQMSTLKWTVSNKGSNVAKGYFRDAVYLSADSVWDVDDALFGVSDTSITGLGQQASLDRQLTRRLSNVATGNYYIIVRTDILNNLLETNDSNNIACSPAPMEVDVKVLTIGVSAADTLVNNQPLYYRINIPAAQKGETMLLTLNSNSVANAVNRLFLGYNTVPAANKYDYISQIPFSANQEIAVPELKEGTYYIFAAGNDGQANFQPVSLLARIIPFQITKVDAQKGGNTGAVTVKISGAKFDSTTLIRLSGANGAISPVKMYYTNSTQVFATFNLLNAKLGLYDVVATKASGDSTKLPGGFEVISGNGSSIGSGGPGSGTGFVCQVVNIGFESQLETGYEYPSSTRALRMVSITIYYANNGSVDIPAPTRFLTALKNNVPLALTAEALPATLVEAGAALGNNLAGLILNFDEPGSPPGILRPGANGYKKVYTMTYQTNIGSMDFLISK